MTTLIGVPKGIISDRGINASKTVKVFNEHSNELVSHIVNELGPTFVKLRQQIQQLNAIERSVLLDEFNNNTARAIAIIGISEHVFNMPEAHAKQTIKELFNENKEAEKEDLSQS